MSNVAPDQQSAVNALLQLTQMTQQNTAKNKAIRSKMDEAKAVIKKYMVENKIQTVPLGNSLWCTLVTKTAVPSMNAQMSVAIFRAYFKSKGKMLPDSDVADYEKFVKSVQERLATRSVELKISKTRPIASLV